LLGIALGQPVKQAERKPSRDSGELEKESQKMKTVVLAATIACLAVLTAFFFGRSTQSSPPPVQPALSEPASVPALQPVTVAPAPAGSERVETPIVTQPARIEGETNQAPAAVAATPAKPPSPIFNQALATLVSAHAPYAQKQSAWQLLTDSGKLDQAITGLEQSATANPSTAEYPATLGQAYLHKAGTLQDIREQGILGMKADQSFDAALAIDPSNWEARFWKATAMSYWPPELGKTKEVVENYLELVKIQEGRPAQPQYAQTYLALGDQYQKLGYPQYAAEIWQRGVTLYPGDAQLQQRLGGQAPAQQAVAR